MHKGPFAADGTRARVKALEPRSQRLRKIKLCAKYRDKKKKSTKQISGPIDVSEKLVSISMSQSMGAGLCILLLLWPFLVFIGSHVTAGQPAKRTCSYNFNAGKRAKRPEKVMTSPHHKTAVTIERGLFFVVEIAYKASDNMKSYQIVSHCSILLKLSC